MALCSTDSHISISLKVQEGNVIWHKILRMLKFHPITVFMKTCTNFKKKIFGQGFQFKLSFFLIKFKISSLDVLLLPNKKQCSIRRAILQYYAKLY